MDPEEKARKLAALKAAAGLSTDKPQNVEYTREPTFRPATQAG